MRDPTEKKSEVKDKCTGSCCHRLTINPLGLAIDGLGLGMLPVVSDRNGSDRRNELRRRVDAREDLFEEGLELAMRDGS